MTELLDLDEEATSLDYEIRVVTKNYKLNATQREVIRKMMTEAAAHLRVKLSMITQHDRSAIHVRTTVRSPLTGVRELALPDED
jgi:hypothetical protein